MKKIITTLLLLFTLTATYAGGHKDKEDKDININVNIGKNGDININGKTYTDKDIEKWVHDHLRNFSINIQDNTDDKAPLPPHTQAKEKKSKTVLTVTIDEK